MLTARRYDLYVLFNDLECVSDEVGDAIFAQNPDDEGIVRSTMTAYVLPWFRRQTEGRQQEIKDSLRYYLTLADEELLHDVLGGIQESPLPEPSSAVWLYGLIWDVLFPGESFMLLDLDGWRESRWP